MYAPGCRVLAVSKATLSCSGLLKTWESEQAALCPPDSKENTESRLVSAMLQQSDDPETCLTFFYALCSDSTARGSDRGCGGHNFNRG